MVSMATKFEVFGDYLTSVSPPTGFFAPKSSPRMPMARPDAALPGPPEPMPTTTSTIKKTNIQIPMARHVVQEHGPLGLKMSPKEGDIAMVVREQAMAPRRHGPSVRSGNGADQIVNIRTIESINVELAEGRSAAYTYEEFPYYLDGVINNVDGADPYNEFRDAPIANVAVQGPCRIDNSPERACEKKVGGGKARINAFCYVGLEKSKTANAKGLIPHRLVRFSSFQIYQGEYDFGLADGYELLFAWTLGRITDANQSPNMLTIQVNIEPIRDVKFSDEELTNSRVFLDAASGEYVYDVSTEAALGREKLLELKKGEVGETAEERLRRMWGKPKPP